MASLEVSDIDLVARLAGSGVTRHELGRYPEPLAPNTAARRAGMAAVRPVVTQPGLGTLNVSALTTEALQHRGLRCQGLVIGSWPVDPDLAMRCNITDLPDVTGSPLRGAIPQGAGDLPTAPFLETARASLASELGGSWDAADFAVRYAPRDADRTLAPPRCAPR